MLPFSVDRIYCGAQSGWRQRGRLRMSTTGAAPSQSLASAAAPAGRSQPFGPPPLIDGDDRAAYDELLAQISAALKPADTGLLISSPYLVPILAAIHTAPSLRGF
jgi:hypothetical protein